MKHHQCGICHSHTPNDRPCHYCGAVFVSSAGKYYNVNTGRKMVRGFTRFLPSADRISVVPRRQVNGLVARLVKGGI